jgi:hypothetical protein
MNALLSGKRAAANRPPPAKPSTRREYVSGLTQSDVDAAKELILQAMHPGAIRTPEELGVLAILEAYISLVQQAKGKRSKGAGKTKAAVIRFHVNRLLRTVLDMRFRKEPTSAATIMKIIEGLDLVGIEASESQVRRAIYSAVELAPIPTMRW